MTAGQPPENVLSEHFLQEFCCKNLPLLLKPGHQ
jgi:hypothetical protein